MLSKNLKKRLSRRKWKVAHLVAAFAYEGVDVNHITVQRWLDNATEPRAIHLRPLALVVGCTIDALFRSRN